MINGKIGTISYDDERARAHGHDPMIMSGVVKADQGELPVGLILTRDPVDGMIPYQEVADEVLATGDGETLIFSGTLEEVPVEPGTVEVSDGVETFLDDGLGRLVGDAGGSGTVYYNTGAISVTFHAAPANETDIEVDYTTAIDGVLDETVDTEINGSATYITHGTVRRDCLKVGAIAKAAPEADVLAKLAGKNIWAV